MKHHKKGRKFGRESGRRGALIRSLALSLIKRGKITTTLAKAKELRPFAEKLISASKKSDLATRRKVIAKLGSVEASRKMISEIGPKYQDRKGGYTRVTKVSRRLSDGSPMAVIEFV